MSLQLFLTTLLVIVQSVVVLGNDIGNFQYNETNVLPSYTYIIDWHNRKNTAFIVFICLWSIGTFICLLLGCICLCTKKSTVTPGRIVHSNKVETGSEAQQSTSSTGQTQPPSYQASQQQPLYPVYQPGMGQQISGVNIQFQNPLGYTVKPGKIVGSTVNDKQTQSSTVQPLYPTVQLPYASYSASEEHLVIGTQNSETEFHNPVN